MNTAYFYAEEWFPVYCLWEKPVDEWGDYYKVELTDEEYILIKEAERLWEERTRLIDSKLSESNRIDGYGVH